MQLKIQRSQRVRGVVGNTIFFCLDVRADYSPEERSNIQRYKLGPQVIYNSGAAKRHLERMGVQLDRVEGGGLKEKAAGLARGAFSMAMAKMSLNISIASLGQGHHIECKDLEELLEAEDTVRDACKNVTRYLQVAETFDGSELVIEYDKGEEKVHVSQGAPSLIAYQAEAPDEPLQIRGTTPAPRPAYQEFAYEGQEFGPTGDALKQHWLAFEQKLLAYAASKGWNANPIEMRIVCGGVAFVVFVILVELL